MNRFLIPPYIGMHLNLFMKKIILSSLVVAFCFATPIESKCQHVMQNNLFTYLQNNFDTTIVFFPTNTWTLGANYYVVSKKDKQFFLFTYRDLYKTTKKYPDSLGKFFSNKESKFISDEPDLNEFLLPKDSEDSILNNYWNDISLNGIWKLKTTDDSIPCFDKKHKQYIINDAGNDIFFLITKSGINHVSIYFPEFFEEHCPGNINRINTIKIKHTFRNMFK